MGNKFRRSTVSFKYTKKQVVPILYPPGDSLCESECPICLEYLCNSNNISRNFPSSNSTNSNVYVTNCGHYFHSHCIYRHRKFCQKDGKSSQCPLCREKLIFRSKTRKKPFF